MLKVADLAGRADFDVGPLHISPGRRLVVGPSGSANLEPIVMKVFLLLIDAAGKVVTRDDLFENAWAGVFVGDDSLNRAIARVRKIASETAPGLFEIETIPRTGYRMTGDFLSQLPASPGAVSPTSSRWSRRSVVAAGALGATLLGATGFGAWKVTQSGNRQFDDLKRRAQEALDYNETSTDAVGLLQQAVALRPDDAGAQGMLAYALVASAEAASKAGTGTVAAASQNAATSALRIDPGNADAKVAEVMLERATLDLLTTEDRLRAILSASPDAVPAMSGLWSLLQSVGRSREALGLVQRATAIKPLSAACNFPLAQLLWINGRTAEADRVIDRAMQFWPAHPFVRWARFTIFTFTGRAKAALAMLDRDDMRPQYFSPESVALWKISLAALDNPSPANVERARAANMDAVKREPRTFSRQALLCLPALGQVDAAFEIANLLFVYEPASRSAEKAAGSTAWAFAPFLFVPPTAALRADRRFAALADGIGLTAYWAKRGIRPDYPIAGV